MMPSRSTRIAAIALAASAVTVPLAASPASADPSSAAKTLAGMKYSWHLKPHALQVTLCHTWVSNRSIAIQSAVAAIAAIPAASAKLTPAETRSVAVKYLRWACPGGTPR